jgi:GT2 family glycosyltransferase
MPRSPRDRLTLELRCPRHSDPGGGAILWDSVVKISVVIPCYRQAAFVRQAVLSVLEQTAGDAEVIMVDDGSPDDPIAVLGELAGEARVKCLQREHRGVSAARNAGIEHSSGAYLVFLDADDWLSPTYCERMLPVLEADRELGLVYCDVHHSYEGGDLEPDSALQEYSVGKSRPVTSGGILPSLLLGGYFPLHAALTPRSVVERAGGFDPELAACEDWDLWLRVAATGLPARYVDERLVFYRKHRNGASRNAEAMRQGAERALAKLLRAAPDATAAAFLHLRNQIAVQEAAASQYFRETQAWIAELEAARERDQRPAGAISAVLSAGRRIFGR